MEKSYRLALSVAVIVALNGCVTIHDKQTKTINPVTHYKTEQAFRTETHTPWPLKQWWQDYQDPQLNQLIKTAIADSPTLQMARARLKQAEGYAQAAGAVKKVQVGLNATASQEKVSYMYQAFMPPKGWNDYGTMTLDFHYDFDFWGKNRSLVAAATSQLATARAENAAAQLMIATAISGQYAELTRLYANLDTVNDALNIRQDTVRLISKRHSFGLENEGAVYRAKSALSSEKANLAALKERIKITKDAIVALVGEGPDAALKLTRPQMQLNHPFGIPEDAHLNLLSHRPDIVAARWRVEASAHRADMAKANFYPDLSLRAFFGFQSYGFNHLFRENNTAGSVGPALYLPVFQGGRLKGQLVQARASYESAVASYDNTLNHALHNVADTLTSIRALSSRLNQTQQAVDSAREAYQVAFDRYHGGLANYLDVLTAEDVFVRTKQQLADLKTRAISLDIELMHALGGGYQNNYNS